MTAPKSNDLNKRAAEAVRGMDGDALLARVEQILARETRKGDMVMCNNLPTHEIAGVRNAFKSVGSNLRFLPPYSPYPDPIEQEFPRIKSRLGRITPRAQTAMYAEPGTAVDLATTENARNHFSSGGCRCAAVG